MDSELPKEFRKQLRFTLRFKNKLIIEDINDHEIPLQSDAIAQFRGRGQEGLA